MAAKGAAARSGAGGPSEEAGAGKQEAAAQDPGTKMGSGWFFINSHQ